MAHPDRTCRVADQEWSDPTKPNLKDRQDRKENSVAYNEPNLFLAVLAVFAIPNTENQ